MARAPSVTGSVAYGGLGGRASPGSKGAWRRQTGKDSKSSFAEINAKYTKIVRSLVNITPKAIAEALVPAFDRSQELVPKLTGALMESGRIETQRIGRSQARGWILYGSSVAWYAALVHERTWIAHRSPTRAKFLQSAMEEEMGQFLAILAVHYAAKFNDRNAPLL